MPASILEIKERLKRVIDDNGTVRDMGVAEEAIGILERSVVTKEDLEATRLGLYVNNIRKAARNSPLAKRAKNLVKSWRQMIEQGTRQCPPVVQPPRLRPETPNSVGSSPSPPEPHDYNTIPTYPSPRTPALPPQRSRPNTPIESGGNRPRKKRDHSESNKPHRKKDAVDGPSTPKVQSSEVKVSNMVTPKGRGSNAIIPSSLTHKDQGSEVKKTGKKQTKDSALMSVGTNGLKLTFSKARPGAQSANNLTEDEEVDVVTNSNPVTLHRSQTEPALRIPTPTSKESRKNRTKVKKTHKSPHKTSSPALLNISSATERLPRQDDVYNNNKTETKMTTSKSSPNVTVQNSSTKYKSPDKMNKTIPAPKSCNDLKNISPESSIVNSDRKRKREQLQVETASLETSPSTDKPRGPKERRLTLTYDHRTKQLQQVPSDVSDHRSSSSEREIKKKAIKVSPKQSSIFKNGKDFNLHVKTKTEINRNNISPSDRQSTEVKIKQVQKVSTKIEKKDPSVPEELVESNEIPTRISPTVSILGDYNSTSFKSCAGDCSANFYETRREFRKRKTRRKETGDIELTSMFPLSNLVENIDSDSTSSDSEHNLEKTFCNSITISEKYEPTHSRICKQPGVTGCRGNNGSWYDWMESFCVRNHMKSEPLPGEDEKLPLQILPYVELD
ncbi:uncharacterized protein LOC120334866 [Styela clava]